MNGFFVLLFQMTLPNGVQEKMNLIDTTPSDQTDSSSDVNNNYKDYDNNDVDDDGSVMLMTWTVHGCHETSCDEIKPKTLICNSERYINLTDTSHDEQPPLQAHLHFKT